MSGVRRTAFLCSLVSELTDFEESETHLRQVHDPIENEKLCAFLIEKALDKLPPGKEEILGIFDLRGFGPENADLKFLTFIVITLHKLLIII